MIYSIKNDFVFLHCPRPSGTALSKSLQVLVPDAVFDNILKHIVWDELPEALKTLRAFTISRPLEDVRQSYFKHITQWYATSSDLTLSTRWLLEHAKRLSVMTPEQYLNSSEPPTTVNGYLLGCQQVFKFDDYSYRDIAEFCRVEPKKLIALMEVFRE